MIDAAKIIEDYNKKHYKGWHMIANTSSNCVKEKDVHDVTLKYISNCDKNGHDTTTYSWVFPNGIRYDSNDIKIVVDKNGKKHDWFEKENERYVNFLQEMRERGYRTFRGDRNGHLLSDDMYFYRKKGLSRILPEKFLKFAFGWLDFVQPEKKIPEFLRGEKVGKCDAYECSIQDVESDSKESMKRMGRRIKFVDDVLGTETIGGALQNYWRVDDETAKQRKKELKETFGSPLDFVWKFD